MMSALIVFVDLGGVIFDKDQQITQRQDLVGECFVRLLGGTQEAWTLAHRLVTNHLEKWEEAYGQAPADFLSFYRSYQLHWVRGMCELLGMLTPAEEECLGLAYRAIASITRCIQAGLPGAVEAIRILHQQGYPLHLASGSCSLELAGYLTNCATRGAFGVNRLLNHCRLPQAHLLNVGTRCVMCTSEKDGLN